MEQAAEFIELYDIPEKLPIVPIRESSDNSVFLIGNTAKKVLRISKRLPVEDVNFEYEVNKHLSLSGIPVANWLTAKTSEAFASVNNELAVMFDFIEGHHAIIDADTLPSKIQAYNAGEALGFVAAKGKNFEPRSPRRRNIFSEITRPLEFQDVFQNEFEGGSDFMKQIQASIEFAKSDSSPIGIIHNDYRTDNVFFDEVDRVNGVIDFDWCCRGPLIKDLALGALEWSFQNKHDQPNEEVFDSFLMGYNSSASDKVAKDKKLYAWILFAALSDTATYFCDRLSSPDLKKRMTSSYMYKKYLYFSSLV